MASSAEALAVAARHHAAGDFARAEEVAWSVLRTEPNHAEALRFLGICAARRREPARAIDYLNRSLLADRTSAAAWKHLGDAYCEACRLGDGIASYEQALCLQPDCSETYNKTAIACH